jgi:hypothetical protein
MDWYNYMVEAKTPEEAIEKWEKGQTVFKERNGVEVTVDGKTTTVKLGDGRVGVAKCNPKDEFDILEGIKVAIEDIRQKYNFLSDRERKTLEYFQSLGCEEFDLFSGEEFDFIRGFKANDENLVVAVLRKQNEFRWLNYKTVMSIENVLNNE